MQGLLDWVEKRIPAMNAYKSTYLNTQCLRTLTFGTFLVL